MGKYIIHQKGGTFDHTPGATTWAERRIRRLFNRSGVSEQDVNILRGILAGIQTKIKDKVTTNE